jgi:hypothetical protein
MLVEFIQVQIHEFGVANPVGKHMVDGHQDFVNLISGNVYRDL